LESGRVIWRQCPKTPGIYEYQDTMDFVGSKTVEGKKELKTKQTASMGTLEDKEYDEVDKLMEESFGFEVISMRHEVAKGKGKSASSSSPFQLVLAKDNVGKGGKGAKAGKGGQGGRGGIRKLAIKDNPDEMVEDEDALGEAPKEEEQEAQLNLAYNKCRAMQLVLTKTKNNMDELVPDFKKNPCANKHLLDMIGINLKDLDTQNKKVKNMIVQKKGDIEVIKKGLAEAAQVVKDSQGWMSKMKLLSHDDLGSVVSKKRAKN